MFLYYPMQRKIREVSYFISFDNYFLCNTYVTPINKQSRLPKVTKINVQLSSFANRVTTQKKMRGTSTPAKVFCKFFPSKQNKL